MPAAGIGPAAYRVSDGCTTVVLGGLRYSDRWLSRDSRLKRAARYATPSEHSGGRRGNCTPAARRHLIYSQAQLLLCHPTIRGVARGTIPAVLIHSQPCRLNICDTMFGGEGKHS